MKATEFFGKGMGISFASVLICAAGLFLSALFSKDEEPAQETKK